MSNEKSSQKIEETLYHYTVESRLKKILESKYILKSPRNKKELLKKELAVVWLTINPIWDKTVFILSPIELLDKDGRIRLTISNIPVLDVNSLRKNLPLLPKLIKSAKEVGVNFRDWRVSKKNIPIDEILKIEKLIDDEWVTYKIE